MRHLTLKWALPMVKLVKLCDSASREQLNELKETYMFETVCSGPSYSDLAEACNIPDELIFEHYDGYDFVNDDFFCSVGM